MAGWSGHWTASARPADRRDDDNPYFRFYWDNLQKMEPPPEPVGFWRRVLDALRGFAARGVRRLAGKWMSDDGF